MQYMTIHSGYVDTINWYGIWRDTLTTRGNIWDTSWPRGNIWNPFWSCRHNRSVQHSNTYWPCRPHGLVQHIARQSDHMATHRNTYWLCRPHGSMQSIVRLWQHRHYMVRHPDHVDSIDWYNTWQYRPCRHHRLIQHMALKNEISRAWHVCDIWVDKNDAKAKANVNVNVNAKVNQQTNQQATQIPWLDRHGRGRASNRPW